MAGENPDERSDGIEKDHIIRALIEENARLNENKILLTATVNQMRSEFTQAQAQWAAERDSILKGHDQGSDQEG